MLYSMARRYDEFPGATEDAGSSLRGAMKGWYKHGACRRRSLARPRACRRPPEQPESDWWLDAAQRPLGAYYRVDTRSVTDMHVGAARRRHSLRERGLPPRAGSRASNVTKGKRVLDDPARRRPSRMTAGTPSSIVGYTRDGFIVQNSWGTEWGTRGLAHPHLRGLDSTNAMDCWVAQLGVVTDAASRRSPARPSLRIDARQVSALARSRLLRNREIVALHRRHGEQRRAVQQRRLPHPKPATWRRWSTFHIAEARKNGASKASEPTDVAIYAHGGLTGEDAARRDRGALDPRALRGAHLPDLPHVGDRPLVDGEEPAGGPR